MEFLKGYYAGVQLMNRAGEKGCFVEYVCLATSVVDALLRTGLVLKHQLDTRSTNVPTELVFQADDDRIVSERKIYEKALAQNIIPRDQFDKLEDLYARRNKVVHRYIISEITTDQVLQIAMEYQALIDSIAKHVKKLEDTQVESGVGMTVHGKESGDGLTANQMNLVQKLIDEKHGNPHLAKNLK